VDGSSVATTDLFKALGDPVRWSIIQQMSEVDELACSRLEQTLPISKPTVSYHTKILAQAGLISVRKEGRNFYYTLRRDVLQSIASELWTVAPGPRPVRDGMVDLKSNPNNRRRNRIRPRPNDGGVAVGQEVVLLTW